MKMENLFNSINIDLSKNIFELNGKRIEHVSELELSCEGDNWSLRITKDEFYTGTRGQKVME